MIPQRRAENQHGRRQIPKNEGSFTVACYGNQTMKTLKRKFTGRIAITAVAILLLLTTLTGCMGGGAQTPTLTLNEDVFSLDKDEMAKHELEPSELKQIAKMIQSAFAKEQSDKAEYNSYEMLVAAGRGYDMTKEDFKDEAQMPDKGINPEAAVNVIIAANAKASENNLTDPQKEELKTKLNAADVELLLAAFRTEVKAETADFWAILYTAIGTVLSWMTVVGFGNYVVGICIFAILIEILMIPFGIKQQKNSIKQAKLRPKEMAIKNKYKGRNDQPTMQKMQAEIQELYQRENFSPASGCLPLLIQLPIIMILYNVVMDPLRYMLGQSASVANALSTYAGTARAAGGLGLNFDTSRGSIELLSKLGESDLAGLKLWLL